MGDRLGTIYLQCPPKKSFCAVSVFVFVLEVHTRRRVVYTPEEIDMNCLSVKMQFSESRFVVDGMYIIWTSPIVSHALDLDDGLPSIHPLFSPSPPSHNVHRRQTEGAFSNWIRWRCIFLLFYCSESALYWATTTLWPTSLSQWGCSNRGLVWLRYRGSACLMVGEEELHTIILLQCVHSFTYRILI